MKTSTPSVLFLVARIDSQTGGMERQALQLASALAARGHEVLFVTAAYRDWMQEQRLRIRGTRDGFPVYRVPILRGWRRLNAALYCAGGVFLLVLLRARYAIIHAHELHSSGLVGVFAKAWLPSKRLVIKVPAVGPWIGDLANLRRLPGAGALLSLVRKHADALVAVSANLGAELRDAHLPNVHVIPNGVDTEVFAPPSDVDRRKARRQVCGGGDEPRPVVLFVGRLGPEKNVPVLIDALKHVGHGVRLLIVGDGELRAALGEQAAAVPDRHTVDFCGAVSDVAPFYRAADVFVLPSLSEGSPNVLLEAMSCGIACIGAAIPGIRAVLDDERTGCLFTGGAEALASTLVRLINDDPLRSTFGMNARRAVLERFSISLIADQYSKLYSSEADGHARSSNTSSTSTR